jgi:hypothetical protein
MKPERLSPAARACASRRRNTRRGSVIFTRSIVSSSNTGSIAMTSSNHPLKSGFARIVSKPEGAGIVSPASSAASIQAAAAYTAPAIASSKLSPAEKQPRRSGTATPNAALSFPGSITMG